jgi:hypothetical protein
VNFSALQILWQEKKSRHQNTKAQNHEMARKRIKMWQLGGMKTTTRF